MLVFRLWEYPDSLWMDCKTISNDSWRRNDAEAWGKLGQRAHPERPALNHLWIFKNKSARDASMRTGQELAGETLTSRAEPRSVKHPICSGGCFSGRWVLHLRCLSLLDDGNSDKALSGTRSAVNWSSTVGSLTTQVVGMIYSAFLVNV